EHPEYEQQAGALWGNVEILRWRDQNLGRLRALGENVARLVGPWVLHDRLRMIDREDMAHFETVSSAAIQGDDGASSRFMRVSGEIDDSSLHRAVRRMGHIVHQLFTRRRHEEVADQNLFARTGDGDRAHFGEAVDLSG